MTVCSRAWYSYLPADLQAPAHCSRGTCCPPVRANQGLSAQSCYSFLSSDRELTQGISDSAPLPGSVYCKTPPHWLCSSVLIIRSEAAIKKLIFSKFFPSVLSHCFPSSLTRKYPGASPFSRVQIAVWLAGVSRGPQGQHKGTSTVHLGTCTLPREKTRTRCL